MADFKNSHTRTDGKDFTLKEVKAPNPPGHLNPEERRAYRRYHIELSQLRNIWDVQIAGRHRTDENIARATKFWYAEGSDSQTQSEFLQHKFKTTAATASSIPQLIATLTAKITQLDQPMQSRPEIELSDEYLSQSDLINFQAVQNPQLGQFSQLRAINADAIQNRPPPYYHDKTKNGKQLHKRMQAEGKTRAKRAKTTPDTSSMPHHPMSTRSKRPAEDEVEDEAQPSQRPRSSRLSIASPTSSTLPNTNPVGRPSTVIAPRPAQHHSRALHPRAIAPRVLESDQEFSDSAQFPGGQIGGAVHIDSFFILAPSGQVYRAVQVDTPSQLYLGPPVATPSQFYPGRQIDNPGQVSSGRQFATRGQTRGQTTGAERFNPFGVDYGRGQGVIPPFSERDYMAYQNRVLSDIQFIWEDYAGQGVYGFDGELM